MDQASKAAEDAFNQANLKMDLTILKIREAKETVNGWKKGKPHYPEPHDLLLRFEWHYKLNLILYPNYRN